MATLRTDELNSQEFDAVEYINNYFEPMRISEERKEERRDAAKDFREILLFILALILMEYDRDVLDWYYIRDQLRKELEAAALEYAKNTEMLQNYLTTKTYNFIETTQDQDLTDPYWTSDERATYEAVNEANDVIAISEMQRAKERGAVKKKWRTENDFRVRLTHRLVEGTTIALDALFSVGKDKMRFPHDWYYSEKESYNCRCGLDYLDENDKVILVGRRGEEVNKTIGKVQYTNAVNSGTINSKNSPMYRLDDEGERIPISEDDYRRITDPAKKDGADIRIANSDDEDMAIVLKRMREQDASAVTYGATVILRDDATISDVLEEVHHFYQNKNGLNDMYGYKERTILNEIDAKEYLLSVQKEYNIPLNEVKTTENQLKSYRRQMEELKASGEWNEPN